VRQDPTETRDVAAANPEIVARLQARVAAARADLGDSLTGAKGANLRPAGDVRQPLPAGVRRVANQTYHSPKEGDVLLDLYLPEKAPAAALPVIVWVHGGGWNKGSKENPPLGWLATEGYAVASINYRLSWLARWPAQIDDVRAAVRWIRVNAAKHGLDPERIAVAGGSAGGHLAALAGTEPPPAGEKVPSRVRAVIDLYGPTDLLTMPGNTPGAGRTDTDLARSNGARMLGGPVRERPELARAASALHHVSSDDPPFLILHGDRDPQVPLEQSQRLHEALRAAGVSSELVVLPGAGHGGKEFATPEIRARIRAFLASALR
jgi:acetyl esterase/lipase